MCPKTATEETPCLPDFELVSSPDLLKKKKKKKILTHE